ncbi:MAG: efflux RND transporter permease subunit, partial [Pseudomonadales bacterium]|nr:efflux RND transporter permease subunit [Pseudomonadales bacterium]
YFQIGMVTLIGLAAKNAILLVEFANQKMKEGMDAKRAALESAHLRFRPIVMTSMAFILGVVPLVIASGAGSAARQSMGTGVFGGMILAAFVATVFVPLFFSWFVSKHETPRSALHWREYAQKKTNDLHYKPARNAAKTGRID